MNYLAHHFFYATTDPYHNAGLLLPDLSRAAKGRRELILDTPFNPIHENVAKGCKGHYDADSWFHASEYFRELSFTINEELTTVKINSELFQNQRSWFIGHILAEMLLDRLIIDRHPGALDWFYQDLKQTDVTILGKFLLQVGKHDLYRFPEVFDGFRSSEFLRYYENSSGIIGSLSRVLVRTGQLALTDSETAFLLERLDQWLDRAEQIKKPHQMARL